MYCGVSRSSRLRSQHGRALRMGGVLRYKLEVCCKYFLDKLYGLGVPEQCPTAARCYQRMCGQIGAASYMRFAAHVHPKPQQARDSSPCVHWKPREAGIFSMSALQVFRAKNRLPADTGQHGISKHAREESSKTLNIPACTQRQNPFYLQLQRNI